MEIVLLIVFTGLLLVLAFGGILYSLHLEEHAFSNCRESQNDVPHSGAGSEKTALKTALADGFDSHAGQNVPAAVGKPLTQDEHNAFPKGRWS